MRKEEARKTKENVKEKKYKKKQKIIDNFQGRSNNAHISLNRKRISSNRIVSYKFYSHTWERN